MALTALIVLTTAGGNTGPFDLYSDTDSFTTPFETNISYLSLTGGYISSLIPDSTTTIRIKSNNITCDNYVDVVVT